VSTGVCWLGSRVVCPTVVRGLADRCRSRRKAKAVDRDESETDDVEQVESEPEPVARRSRGKRGSKRRAIVISDEDE
jgi:hypothetical protein